MTLYFFLLRWVGKRSTGLMFRMTNRSKMKAVKSIRDFVLLYEHPHSHLIPGDDPVSLRRCRCELLVVLSTCVRFRPWAHGTRAVKIPRKCCWGKQNNVVAFLGYRAAFVRGSRVAHVCGEKDGVRAGTLCVGVRNRLRTSRRSGFRRGSACSTTSRRHQRFQLCTCSVLIPRP